MISERGSEEKPTCKPPKWRSLKGRKDGWQEEVCLVFALSFFWAHVRKLETRIQDGRPDWLLLASQGDCLEGKGERASMFIENKDDELLITAFNGNPVE